MGRKKKEGIDYFPHFVNASNKMTLETVEGLFGNDGYAFWFKLLELLGTQEGHYLDCSKLSVMGHLVKKTNLKDQIVIKILDVLAEINAIDENLWAKHKVIWSQNFVDWIAGVYEKRKADIPKKPFSVTETGISVTETAEKQYKTDSKTAISVEKSTQSKVKKSKGNKRIENTGSNEPVWCVENPDLNTALCAYAEYRKKLKKPLTDYAMRLVISKLNTFASDTKTQIDIINQSIERGWLGIFPLSSSSNLKNQESTTTGYTVEEIQRLEAEWSGRESN